MSKFKIPFYPCKLGILLKNEGFLAEIYTNYINFK